MPGSRGGGGGGEGGGGGGGSSGGGGGLGGRIAQLTLNPPGSADYLRVAVIIIATFAVLYLVSRR